MRGETMGPWIAGASLHVAHHTDRIVGQILVNETTANGMILAGPFVTDLCVKPAVAGHGIGSALLTASACRLADLGWSTLTLVVTVGNPGATRLRTGGLPRDRRIMADRDRQLSTPLASLAYRAKDPIASVAQHLDPPS